MSEKQKAPKAKVAYKSKGERASGGRVPNIDFNAITQSLVNPPEAKNGGIGTKMPAGFKKALALVRRANRHVCFA